MNEYSAQFRVYSEDTDMMGIVFHANYLSFFERARTEMLRANGFYLTMLAKHDTHFAIYAANIRYHSPARLDDVLDIRTRLAEVKKSRLEFQQVMYNQCGVLLSEVLIQAVCVSGQLRPKRLPNALLELIKSEE